MVPPPPGPGPQGPAAAAPGSPAPGGPEPDGPERDALRFPRLLLTTRFQLLGRFAPEVEAAPGDAAALRARWDWVLARGDRALRVRMVVTVLLGFSVFAAGAAAALELARSAATAGDPAARAAVQGLLGVLDAVQAAAASLAAVLLVARVVLDRHLDLATAAAGVLAMLLARAAAPGPGGPPAGLTRGARRSP